MEMVVDFQHHYTPPELMETGKPGGSVRVDENGNPNYRFNPLLADLSAHVRMMDSGTAEIPRHSRMPREPFDHYLEHRFFYDCAGWSGPDHAAERGAEWMRVGLAELPWPQVLFATDYPQAVRNDDEVTGYVTAVAALGGKARKVLDGANAGRLIPNLNERAQPTAVTGTNQR